MAVATPARKTAPAPPPSRTTPPRKKARSTPQKRAAPAPAAPKKRAAPGRAAPRKRAAPARSAPRSRAAAQTAPARQAPVRAPRRAEPKTKRAVGGQLIPLAGRTAVAVRQLPDSGLVVRMTRGRAWIAVLGVLLVGIVTLNVITLSFAASSGKIDEQLTTLDQENSILNGRVAHLDGVGNVRNAATALGLSVPSSEDIHFTDAGPNDVATAVQRLAAAGPG
jgi:hypothetical protein